MYVHCMAALRVSCNHLVRRRSDALDDDPASNLNVPRDQSNGAVQSPTSCFTVEEINACYTGRPLSVKLSWNSTGPTPTRTPTPTDGWMRLSCNFVSVYIHVYTRASLTDILARGSSPGKSHMSDKSARMLVRVRLVELNGEVAGHADILATILARKSARMSVSVSVSSPWIASFNKHLTHARKCSTASAQCCRKPNQRSGFQRYGPGKYQFIN